MKNVLVMNCIIDAIPRDYFDDVTIPSIMNHLNARYKIFRITDSLAEINLADFSHLLISGSELSASKENEWDSLIYQVIEYFLDEGKPILGICYGHQMLAKAILGNIACRRAAKPEFGFFKVKIVDNFIFKGIESPVFTHSHYDEVCNLKDDFKMIASTEDCDVQGFQYKNTPVWGVQFHPEIGYEQATKMFEDNLKSDPSVKQYFKDELENPEKLNQNIKVFENFIQAI